MCFVTSMKHPQRLSNLQTIEELRAVKAVIDHDRLNNTTNNNYNNENKIKNNKLFVCL